MRWLPLALLAVATVLLQPWISTTPDLTLTLSRTLALLFVGLAWSLWMIHTLRAGTYQRWPLPFRWAFLGLTVALVGLSVVGWIDGWAENMGWPATLWFIGAPFIYGLLERWPRTVPQAAPPA
jgi:hypothetical protein